MAHRALVTISSYRDGLKVHTIDTVRVVHEVLGGYKINWLSGRKSVAKTAKGFATADFATSMPAKLHVMEAENEICTSLGIPKRWSDEQLTKKRQGT